MRTLVKPRDGRRWLWASSLTILCLGGFISTSPLIGAPIHMYAAVVLALALSVAILRRFWWPGAGWIVALWVAFGLAAIVHPSSTAYGGEKIFQLFTATLLAAAAPLWLIRGEKRQRALTIVLYLFAGFVTALAVVFPDNSGRLSLLGTNYVGSGRIICLFFAISLLLLGLRIGPRVVTTVLVALSGYAAFQTGSRGPLLAAIVAVLIVILFRAGTRSTRLLKVTGGFLAVVCMLAIVVPTQTFQDSRFAGLANPDQNVSSRLAFFSDALQIGLLNPAGVGWGNMQLHLSDASVASAGETLYPHNLLLEVWAEGGWLSTVLLVAFVVASMVKMQRASSRNSSAVLWGISLFFLVNALVSADINGNRILFGFLILAWTLGPVNDDLPGSLRQREAGRSQGGRRDRKANQAT